LAELNDAEEKREGQVTVLSSYTLSEKKNKAWGQTQSSPAILSNLDGGPRNPNLGRRAAQKNTAVQSAKCQIGGKASNLTTVSPTDKFTV
jgi:hypothetical protein